MTNKICPNCGVELDRGIESCPLCEGIRETDNIGETSFKASYPSDLLKMNARQKARYGWELSGIIALSGIMVSLFVDLIIIKGLSWSLYSITVLTGIWLIISLFIFFRKKYMILLSGLAFTTLGMQAAIDLFAKPFGWFVSLSIPFTISFFILTAVVLLLTSRARYKGFNILAIVFIAIAVQCFIFEIFTDIYTTGEVTIDWSAITASAIIPFSGILIFIHYRLKRGLNLKSYFHV